jgi:dihydrofolate reductase
MNKSIELIYAVNSEGVIGIDGKLPWHIPEDLKRFKDITMGHIVLMGRKTYESIGKALPGRTNIVISTSMKQEDYRNITIYDNLHTPIKLYKESEASLVKQKLFIIGGSSLFHYGLSIADKIHLTEVYGKHLTDDTNLDDVTFITSEPGSAFNLIGKTAVFTSTGSLNYSYLTYKRKQNG